MEKIKMEKMESKKRQNEVLDMILDECEKNKLVAVKVPEEEAGIADMAVVRHSDKAKFSGEVLGEYYFLPVPESEKVFQYFVCSLTLSDDLDTEFAWAVQQAISKINFTLSSGAFLMSPDQKLLSFRYVLVQPVEQEISSMKLGIRAAMVNALRATAKWKDILSDMDSGKMEYNDFLKQFGKQLGC